MKKLILGAFAISISLAVNAQTIQLDGVGPDVSGTIVDLTYDINDILPLDVKFIVTNTSASNQQMRVQRVRENVPSDWNDNVCWPPQCYLTGNAANQVWESPADPTAPIILSGQSMTTDNAEAELKPQYFPGTSANSTALFWYYLTDNDLNKLDSVGVRINFLVGLEETISTLDLSVSPNPATDYINVKAEGVSTATVKVVDILGNIVREEKVQGQKKIDVLDLNNGVYFVILESEGLKPVNKKIIVRH